MARGRRRYGVGAEGHVAAGLRKDEVHPVHVDLYARHRGAPPGRWSAVDHEWSRRAAEAPDLAALHAYDVYRLTPTGTTWELGA
ncbi:MAG: hypothetical protein ACR2HR_06380 [Euzebya sp.]